MLDAGGGRQRGHQLLHGTGAVEDCRNDSGEPGKAPSSLGRVSPVEPLGQARRMHKQNHNLAPAGAAILAPMCADRPTPKTEQESPNVAELAARADEAYRRVQQLKEHL